MICSCSFIRKRVTKRVLRLRYCIKIWNDLNMVTEKFSLFSVTIKFKLNDNDIKLFYYKSLNKNNFLQEINVPIFMQHN